MDAHFELCNVPIFNFRIRGVVRPRNINSLHYPSTPHISTLNAHTINRKIHTIMKQLPRLIPLVRPKLPHLPRRHHTHHPLPRVRAKLGQRLHRVHDEIGKPCDCFLPAAIDHSAFVVDGDEVVRFEVAFGSGTGTGFL